MTMNISQSMIDNYPSLKAGTPVTMSDVPEGKRHPSVSFTAQKAFNFLSRLPGVYRRPLVALSKTVEDYLDAKCIPIPRTDAERQMGLPRKVAREVGSHRDPLSNFWPTPIWIENVLWPSREHYIASCKVMLTSGPVGALNPSLRGAYDKIINYCHTRNWDSKRADAAKKAGEDLVTWEKRRAWEDVREQVVKKALMASAFQDLKFLENLLDPAIDVFYHIIESQSLDRQHPYWCWGYNPKGNANKHGVLLTQVRTQVISMAQWLATYMKNPTIYVGKKEIYFGSKFDRKSLCLELRWILTYTYLPRGFEGSWMFRPYQPVTNVTQVTKSTNPKLLGSRPKPKTETATKPKEVTKVTKPVAVKESKPLYKRAFETSVKPMPIATTKPYQVIKVLPPPETTTLAITSVASVPMCKVVKIKKPVVAIAKQFKEVEPHVPRQNKVVKQVQVTKTSNQLVKMKSLPKRKIPRAPLQPWSRLQNKINRDLASVQLQENPGIDLLEEQKSPPRSKKVEAIEDEGFEKEPTSALLADMAAMVMSLSHQDVPMDVDEDPNWNVHLEKLNKLPSKSNEEGSFCSGCGKTFTPCNFRKHVFGVHLPWFLNTTKSCWTCGMMFRQNKPMQKHFEKNQDHKPWDKARHLTPWACLVQGLFQLLASFYGCRDLNEFFQAIVPKHDPTRYIKVWENARNEVNANCLAEDWHRIMHLPQNKCTLDPPNCIAAMVHYRTILNLIQILSDEQKEKVKTFNVPVKMKDLGVGAKTPLTYGSVPVQTGKDLCESDVMTNVSKPTPMPLEKPTKMTSPAAKRVGDPLVQPTGVVPVKKLKVSETVTPKKKAPFRARPPSMVPKDKIPIVDAHFHWDHILDLKPNDMTMSDVMNSPDIRYNLTHCVPCYCYPIGWIPSREKLPAPANKIAIGWHPNRFQDYKNKDGTLTPYFEGFKKFLKMSHVIAIGEIGLDYDRAGHHKNGAYEAAKGTEDRRKQKELLHNLLTASEKYLPVIVHCRENYRPSEKKFRIPKAYLDCISIFKQYLGKKHEIYLHCFDGNKEMVDTWNAAFDNVYFGINLMAAGKKAHPGMRSVIQSLRGDRYMLETDAPYLRSPMRARGTFPLPWMVVDVAHYVATVRNSTAEEVLRQTSKAADVFFKWG